MAITYTVVSGDSLSAIAQRYGTTTEQLIRDNAISDPDRIQTGQQFVVGAIGGGSQPVEQGVGSTHSARGAHQTNPFTDSKSNQESDEVKNGSETRANKEKTYTARATVIGNPALKSNTLIKINNVGAKFGGHWWIKTVTHKINSSGYICDLELQKDAISTQDGDTTGFGSPITENPGTGTPQAPRDTGMGPQEPGAEGGNGGANGGGRVYIDPVTGETWTGQRPRTPGGSPGGNPIVNPVEGPQIL